MLSSQDLRFLQEADTVVPQRAEIIVSRLQPHFLGQTSNGTNQIMVRFRSKGGEMDSVRASMNSDVIDVFTTSKVKEEVLSLLNEKLGFDIQFIETPYCFYLVKWDNEPNQDIITTHLDTRQDNRILNVNWKYVCDTSVGSFTLRLPRTAINKDFVIIQDQNGTFQEHPLKVVYEGGTIINKPFVFLDMPHTTLKLTYIAHSNKWIMDI